MRSALLFLALVLSASPVLGQVPGSGAVYMKTRAERMMDERNYKGAVTWLENARERHPKDPVIPVLLGECLFALERPAEAVEQFRIGIEIDPSLAMRIPNHPYALYKLGRLDEAMQLYDGMARDARKAPLRAQGEFGRALVHAHRGRLDEAIAALRRAHRLDPESKKVAYRLGTFLRRAGRPAEATPWFERVIERDGLHLGAIHNLALTWAQLRDREKSAQWRERYDRARRDAEEVRDLETRLRERPGDIRMLRRLGTLLFVHRRYLDAAAAWKVVAVAEPADLAPRWRYALCLYRAGDLSGARRQLEQIVRRDPGHAEAGKLLDTIHSMFKEKK